MEGPGPASEAALGGGGARGADLGRGPAGAPVVGGSVGRGVDMGYGPVGAPTVRGPGYVYGDHGPRAPGNQFAGPGHHGPQAPVNLYLDPGRPGPIVPPTMDQRTTPGNAQGTQPNPLYGVGQGLENGHDVGSRGRARRG